jgi:hypothetical protein
MSSNIKLRCLDNNGSDLFVVNSDLGIFSSSTHPSLNSTTGSLVFYGGVSIHNTSNAVSNVQGGALTVAGGASFQGDIYVDGNIYSNNIGGTQSYVDLILTSTENAINIGSGGSLSVLGGAAISKTVLVGEKVGINNTNPSCALDVDGDIFATGNVTSFSDARLKSDIVTISDAIEKVNQLRGVYFTQTSSNRRSLGLIAQEVQTVIPEAVTDIRGDGYLGVAYGNIIGLLIEAIKELSEKVNNQHKH